MILYKIIYFLSFFYFFIMVGCTTTVQKIIPGPAQFPVRVVSLQELPDGYFWEYGCTDQRGIYYNHICYPDAHYIGDSLNTHHIVVDDLAWNK
jgi:hypothetical protein